MRMDEFSLEIGLARRTTKGSSSGRIMRLVPVFILETHNPDELQNILPSSFNIYNMKHYISCNRFSAKETICSSFPV